MKSLIYRKSILRNSDYNYDEATYSSSPETVYVCWQPITASSTTGERGVVDNKSYQAVLYDDTVLTEGDLIYTEKYGWLEVESIKLYMSHRQIIAHITERRASNG